MYVAHLPLYIMLITVAMPMDPEFQEAFFRVLFFSMLALMGLMLLVSVFNAVMLIRSAMRGEDPTKATMKAKLALIPWYVINFVIVGFFSAIFLNPFMMISIPIIIALAVLVTYVFMLTTSLGDIAYFVRKKLVLGEPLGTATILGVFFSFLFCLDVVGAIILYRRSEVIPEQASPETPADQN